MRRHLRIVSLSIALAFLGLPTVVRAQGMGSGGTSMPGMGPLTTPSGMITGAGQSSQSADPGLAVKDSYVGFLDGAAPRSTVGIRFDGFYNIRQPMRAEYLFAKGGLPNSVGFPLPEPRVNYLELTSFAEYSMTPWLSAFIEGPFRWINPEVNANQYGAGDMRYGMKLCTWSSDAFIATILLRLYQPTARHDTMGTGHWSVEPGLLAAWRINDKILLEGEARYWTPLGGSDFGGDMLRYGVGASYKFQTSRGIWFAPVVEGIGWTLLSGKTMVATSADNFEVQNAYGQTIVNAYAGVRLGYGTHLDLYLGYGRSLTEQFWSRDSYRFEFRFSY